MPPRLLLRQQRVGATVMTYIGIVYALINSAAYPFIAGRTAAARLAFGAQIDLLGGQIAWLLPAPVRADTAGGYLQWRGYGVFAIVFAAWGLLAACGTVRRDEERGLVQMWLATGISRLSLLASRSLTFAALSAAVVAIAGFAGWLGCLIAGLPVAAGGVAAESLALWALTLAVYGLGLLVAQLAPAYRAAVGAAAAVVVVMFLLDSLSRSSAGGTPLAGLSVFHLYNRSHAVAPGGAFDLAATLLLFAVAVLATGIAALSFARRDLDAGLFAWRARRTALVRVTSSNPLLRAPVLRGLWIRRVGVAAWALGCAALAAFVVSLVGVTYDLFSKTPALSGFLRGLSGDLRVVLLALIWFAFAQGLVAVLAITHVARWANEDSSGVLEMDLAQPYPRSGVLLERAAELLVTMSLAVFVAAAVILALAPSQHVDVPASTLLTATALLIPFGLTFGAAGGLLAGWRPRATVGVLATIAGISYLLYFIAPLFHWPSWAVDLSVFQLYGTPLVTPIFTGGLVAMCMIVVAGLGAACVAMVRRDVAA